MNDWTEGYVADVGYTHGYYAELNPLKVQLALLMAGIECPDINDACELGFGQGMSINIHAAAGTAAWVGTDFNPSQVAHARGMAASSASGARLFDQGFEEFNARTDLAEFDFIGLHGIWSWVNDENRAVIVDFVRRRLKVGGVLYLSYNTLPGWSAVAPLRHLMTEHARVLSPQGGSTISKVEQALDFTQKLFEANPAYTQANPLLADRFKRMKTQDRSYLAHEYFNRDWHPMYFADVVERLRPAKVQFAASANLIDHLEPANLSAEQRSMLQGIPDGMFRQSARDFMVNQQFRRDLWVRGARPLSPLERTEALRALRVVLVVPREQVPEDFSTPLGKATFKSNVSDALLDILGDHSPRELGLLGQELSRLGISFNRLLEVVSIFAGLNILHPAQSAPAVQARRDAVHKINRCMLRRARSGAECSSLASAVTGGGVAASRFAQMFLDAHLAGSEGADACAAAVWGVIGPQGQRLLSNGRRLETEGENLAELKRMAVEFYAQQFPVLQALEVLPI